MTAALPPRRPKGQEARLATPPPSRPAQQALIDLAALAARVCGVPWAWIRVGEGPDAQDFPAPGFGDTTVGRAASGLSAALGITATVGFTAAGSGLAGDPPFSESVPAPDAEGKILGRLIVADTEAREFSAERKQILAGLGRQAGALLDLDRRASGTNPANGANGSKDAGGDGRIKSQPMTASDAEIAPHFKTFLDHLPTTAFIKDENHRYVFANRAFWKVYNGTGEEGDPRQVDETRRLTPESVEKIREADRRVMASGEKLEFVEKLAYDGSVHTWWVCKFPIPGNDGRPHVGGITLDISDLDKAQADSRLFDHVFRNIEVGVVIWRLDDGGDVGSFRLIAMNTAAGRIAGLTPQEILGKPMRETFPAMIEMGYAEILRSVLETETPRDMGEIKYGDARVKTSYFNSKFFPLPDRSVGIVFEKISGRRRIQDQLRQSVKRFELISRATNDALWELDPSTGEVWWNERVYTLLGYVPTVTKPSVEAWIDRLHSEDRERVVGELRSIAAGMDDTFTREYRIVRPDGTLVFIYARGCVSRDEAGGLVRILGAMTDISDLKRAEQSMRESEERYRKLVELLPDVVAVSIDGILEFVNQAGLDFRGADRMDEMVGRNVLDFIHPDDRLMIVERQKQLSTGFPVPPLPFRFLRKDGSWLEAESRAVPFPFRGRKANLIVIRDVTERKRAEESLRRSEEHYRLLFHGNAQPMYLFDLNTLKFLDVNLAAEAQYGYTREEFLSMTIRELRPPEDVPFLEDKVRVLRNNGGNMGVWRHRRKDGSLILAEVMAHALEESGSPTAIALAYDVTEKLQAVDKLRHSEERYRTLARVSPVGLFRTDPTGLCTYVNEHCILITGLRSEDLEGRGWVNCIHVEDKDRVKTEWERTLALDIPFQAEYRLVRPEGKIVWVLGRALADRGSDGALIGYVGTVTDITERKHAETLLAGQKRTLAMVASGWALADVLNGLLQYVEKEAAGMTGGILLLEADSRRLAWASSPGIPEGLRQALENALPTVEAGPPGLAASERRMVICSEISEEPLWALGRAQALAHGFRSCAALPILGSYGGLLGSIVFFYRNPGEPAPFDIKLLETASDLAGIAVERWRQEEIGRLNQELSEENRRILEANRMKSEFMASMSHELRTPLNAIIGFSQLLIDRKVGAVNDKQSEYLGDILDGGMHLLRLINDVLDLAKIESGKMQLFPEPVSVARAIREVCDILMPMALAKAIHFRILADLEPENAILDSQKFKQVLYNLISNAIKFSRQGGLVLVGAERGETGELRLKVTDHGIGIRKEDLSKLFQEFQQLDSGAARHFPGTGLGLVITKKLVELHRGTVGVESEAGKGSTFFAVFPEMPAPEAG